MAPLSYTNLIVADRLSPTVTKRKFKEEFTSDKSRIIFSSPLRRLQQKAQVFSLETNASVRSRLTHTLEVATIGISIADKIVARLIDSGLLDAELEIPFVRIVENACLLHDLGNPPFGHFAEEAIKKWFRINWRETFIAATSIPERDLAGTDAIINILLNDFLNFDGNPQGIRIVTTLQDIKLPTRNGTFTDSGLNLTISQIAAILKYTSSPSEVDKSDSLKKKAGFFYTEAEKISLIKKRLGITGRYPLVYIMEAADDISYCLSDIEDGIEKKIFTPRFFFDKLSDEYDHTFPLGSTKFQDIFLGKKTIEEFYEFKIRLIRSIEEYAVINYVENHDEVINGSIAELIDKNSDEGRMLKCLKNLSRKYLFRSSEAENKELAGYHAIFGILDKYKSLLEIGYKKFNDLVSSKMDIHSVLGSGMDLQWRLFNKLPEKYVDAYKFAYLDLQKKYKDETIFKQYEWIYRAHLIVDYIAGMTDNYVLETYNLLYGIKI